MGLGAHPPLRKENAPARVRARTEDKKRLNRTSGQECQTMPSIRSSLQSRLIARVTIATSVFLCFICIAAWGEDYLEHHLVQPVGGEYSTTLSAEKVRIEYFDSYHGELSLKTSAAGYSDDFYLTSGSFSGSHTADAYSLSREIELSGGGEMHAVTVTYASNTVTEVTFGASKGSLSQSIDFGNAGVDPPGVTIDLHFKDPVPGWLEIFYNGEDAEIRSFSRAFGLSEAQATPLYRAGVPGLIGVLSRFGYSATDVVNLALTKGLAYLEELLGKLSGGYVPGPIDRAARKFGIPRVHAKKLFNETNDYLFCSAVRSANDYLELVGNLLGWAVVGTMLASGGGIVTASQPVGGGTALESVGPFGANKIEAKIGEPIRLAFKLLHPVNHQLVFADPWLEPYLALTQVQADGSLMALGGYYGYIAFRLNSQTGEYFSYIDTTDLEPGTYYAYLAVRNPQNDNSTTSRIEIKIRKPLGTYYWG